MPWRQRSVVQEKQSFIMEWLADGVNVSELCRTFGISRTLGYAYIKRYQQDGFRGLEELSRAPRRVWNKTAPCVEKLIVSIRRARPRWGAWTIYLILRKAVDRRALPAVSTIDLILKRHGLVKKRRRVRRIREVHPVFVAERPNQIWSADFKGKFRTGDKHYCYPLTIMDTYSRYVLGIVGMRRPTFEGTKAAFEAVFEEYGLPQQIHTDNGEPFASSVSLSRLTHLAVWFMDLGIVPVYSDPGHPEQNPEHERMHADLKAEATHPVAWDMGSQQKKFKAFRHEHNDVRPHQALHGHMPQELYYRCARLYDGTIEPYQYPAGIDVRYVCRNGAIRWKGNRWVGVSTTLVEKYVGLEVIAPGLWRVYYRNYLLGYLDEKRMRIMDDKGRYQRAEKKV